MTDRADIIRFAREAKVIPVVIGHTTGPFARIERFAELLLAAERTARQAAQVTAEGLKTELARVKGFEKRYQAHRDAVLAEREACAQVLDAMAVQSEADGEYSGHAAHYRRKAAEIRARPEP